MKSSASALARLCLLAILVLGLAASARPARALDDELLGALKRVEHVEIVGNESIKDKAIKKVLKTGADSFLGLRAHPLYRPDFLKADVNSIKILYARRGFLDASVSAGADSGKKPGHVVVTYHVDEGPQVMTRTVIVDSTQVVSADQVRSWIKTKAGEPFDPFQVPVDRNTIAGKYADDGRFPTITTETKRDSLWVDVRFVVAEGPVYRIDEVRITGVAQVETTTVRRELLLKPGETFERDEMVKSTERLYSTGLFVAAEIEPAGADSASGAVDLAVRVRERKKRWVSGGVGTGTQEKIRLTGDWGRRNLSGTGNMLTARAKFGWYESDLYSAGVVLAYIEPWLLNTRTRGTVAVSLERDFELFSTKSYIQEAAGISFGLAREFSGPKDRISFVVDNTWTRLAKVINEDPSDTTTFELPPYVRRYTLAFDQDLRDDPLDARRGSLNNVTLQVSADAHHNTGRYFKNEASTGRHFPFRDESSIAARVRAGYIGAWGGGGDEEALERAPVTDRYRTGGASSVRGYPDNFIDGQGNGGLLVVVTNLEYRFPLRGIFGGTFFLDGGNAWERKTDFKWSQFISTSGPNGSLGPNDYRWAYGFGLRVRTPIGPVRVEYGLRFLGGDAFHFSIGNMF